MTTRENFTTPVGRLVGGSAYKGSTQDAEGRPLVYKNGPDAGKPRVDFYLAIAIPKGAEAAHGALGWMATDWGAKIRKVAEAWLPHAAQLPGFAWKVTDGDSTIPNKKGKKPCDQEGYAGHWVLRWSGGYAPKIYTLVGQQSPAPLEGVDAVNLGDYVQINGTCEPNQSQSQPGVYLNHSMLCLIGYGQRIVLGPDVDSAGFGGALPAGASTVPPAGFTPPVPGASPPTSVPAAPPALPAAPVTAPSTPPLPPAPPNPAFLQPPAPVRVMTPAAVAQGFTYDALKGAGWSDAQMIQAGYLAA